MITIAEPLDLDALRIRHEFISLPDLQVTADTMALLLGVSQRHALLALESLVHEAFLRRLPDDSYVRQLPE